MNLASSSGISRLIIDIKKLAVEEESSRAEVVSLKESLYVEEQAYRTVKYDYEKLCLETSGQDNYLQKSQDLLNSSKVMREWMKEFIKTSKILRYNMEQLTPTDEQLAKQLETYESNIERMISQYELSPTYLAILEQDKAERELSKLIVEKQNELMKLETQREF